MISPGDLRKFHADRPAFSSHLQGTHVFVIRATDNVVDFMCHGGTVYRNWSVDYLDLSSSSVDREESS
jgi:hypothetical protein